MPFSFFLLQVDDGTVLLFSFSSFYPFSFLPGVSVSYRCCPRLRGLSQGKQGWLYAMEQTFFFPLYLYLWCLYVHRRNQDTYLNNGRKQTEYTFSLIDVRLYLELTSIGKKSSYMITRVRLSCKFPALFLFLCVYSSSKTYRQEMRLVQAGGWRVLSFLHSPINYLSSSYVLGTFQRC